MLKTQSISKGIDKLQSAFRKNQSYQQKNIEPFGTTGRKLLKYIDALSSGNNELSYPTFSVMRVNTA